MDRCATIAAYQKHTSSGQAKLARWMNTPIEETSQGCWVNTDDGQTYLNAGGYGVFLLGHRHPKIVQAVLQQLQELPLSTRMFINRQLPTAAVALAQVAPGDLDQVCFTNSGAEATELALKLAILNDRQRFIAMQNGFHGKTLAALSVSGREHYKKPFSNCLLAADILPYNDIDILANNLRADQRPAAVILEPIQAEAGVIIPDPDYLSAVRKCCEQHGALLIVDEIQTGLGRTGAWWASEAAGITPDILLVGKILGGGVLPAAAIVTRESIYRKLSDDPYLHSSTFAGNPLTMAVVKAVIDVLKKDKLIERADHTGTRLLSILRSWHKTAGSDICQEIRGKGLLIGLEFVNHELASRFILNMLEHRVVVSHSMNRGEVVRIIPPAVMNQAEFEHLVQATIAALSELKPIC